MGRSLMSLRRAMSDLGRRRDISTMERSRGRCEIQNTRRMCLEDIPLGQGLSGDGYSRYMHLHLV